MEQNNEIATAWDFVENTGCSIFLTGKAGTGKTTFLRRVVAESRKNSIVVAPTGVAAINAGGITIHSFFQLPFSPFVPGTTTRSKYDFGSEKRRMIASLDMLIIDEISMVRADMLDAIDAVLRRFRDHYRPFGGVQLLLIGDLSQLAPVVTPDDERLLAPHYDTFFFFGSKALRQVDYVTIQLSHVYRQQDEDFISILNQIRDGHPSQEVLDKLNARCVPIAPRPGESYIRLTTHNYQAEAYNESELARLPGQPFSIKAEVKDDFPSTSFPTAETLVLKQGAQVMFVKNDPSSEHRYYNGLIGRISHIEHGKISVLCEGDKYPIIVEPLVWENTHYTINEHTHEIESKVLGTFKQIPLKLAWAITIHKSQGLTFDHAIIDAHQSFAPGQVYVALSRCRTLDGLVLATPLTPSSIVSDVQVSTYMQQQQVLCHESLAQLPRLKQDYERSLLQYLFDFRRLVQQQESLARVFDEYFCRSQAALTQMHHNALLALRQQVLDVASRWQQQIAQMPVDALRSDAFLARVKRSADYFATAISSILDEPLRLSAMIESNNKQAKHRLATLLNDQQQSLFSLRNLLTYVAENGFSVDDYLRVRHRSALEKPDTGSAKKTRSRSGKTKTAAPPKTPTWETSYQLFCAGHSPEDISIQRGLTASTVYGHLSRYVQSGQIAIEQLVSPSHVQAISAAVQQAGSDAGLSPIKHLCPPDITFDEIRVVLNSLKS